MIQVLVSLLLLSVPLWACTCPHGQVPNAQGSHCFSFHESATTFSHADAACRQESAQLATIRSHEDLSIVDTKFSKGTANAVFIGLTQSDGQSSPDSGWTFYDANAGVSPIPWQAGQPNDRNGQESNEEQCGILDTQGTLTVWDASCSRPAAFLCEQQC